MVLEELHLLRQVTLCWDLDAIRVDDCLPVFETEAFALTLSEEAAVARSIGVVDHTEAVKVCGLDLTLVGVVLAADLAEAVEVAIEYLAFDCLVLAMKDLAAEARPLPLDPVALIVLVGLFVGHLPDAMLLALLELARVLVSRGKGHPTDHVVQLAIDPGAPVNIPKVVDQLSFAVLCSCLVDFALIDAAIPLV